MSDIGKSPEKSRKSIKRILVLILVVAIPSLVYGIGLFIFPLTILSNYHGRNCESVLSLDTIYKKIYPAIIRDSSFSGEVGECEQVTQARSNEQNGNWQAAYDSYLAYSKTYPSGLYVMEAYEQSAFVLMSLAKDQAGQENYADALTSLNLIITNYPDLKTSEEALAFVPSVYSSWGADLREAESFDIAERVFNDFRSWIQTNQKPELETDALEELARTYLDWGLALQFRKEYDAALVKFDMAANLDPRLPPDIVAEARSDQRKLYVAWGNELMEQGKFDAAIETFRMGVSRSDGNNEDGVSGALMVGYIRWAEVYVKDEDFEGALEKLAAAGDAAISDELKETLNEALDETYLEFSKSSGIQAQRAMRAALIAVCDRHKKPDLPIFGLSEEAVRFGIYGVDAELPDDLTPQTPGEMHYIACVEEGNNPVDTRQYRQIVLRFAGGYYYRIVTQYRAELLWYVSLFKTDTLEEVGEKTFTGGTPPPFEDSGGTYFYGPPPDVEDVAGWLKSAVD